MPKLPNLPQMDDPAEPVTFDEESPAAPDWHRSLAAAIRDPARLLNELSLSDHFREPAQRAARTFPVMVPRSFLDRIRPGDPNDPLLRQVLPLDDELQHVPGFSVDAVGDHAARSVPGLLQKYHGRVLLITTGSCAVHCRYCFRRSYPYEQEPRRLDDWTPAIRAIAEDPSITEVILSGGDPLMLTDARLAQLISRLNEIPHLQRLRLHSRLPIVLPDRVTSELLDLLTHQRLQPMMVVHANHGNEVVADCANALRRLVRHGIPVLNQAVLLKHVNDSVDAQQTLSERLINIGVMPYYLHQLDRVRGTAHFEVPDRTGLEIIAELRRRLPGYAVPQFVREVPGTDHKVPVEQIADPNPPCGGTPSAQNR